jgi:hypothetical protein
LIASGLLGPHKSTLCTTGDGFDLLRQTRLSGGFDDHVDLESSDSLVSRIKSSSFVVTERLHPAIIAICFGKPFIYLQTTSKAFDLQHLLRAVSPHQLPGLLFLDMTRGDYRLSQRTVSSMHSDELPYELVAVAQLLRDRLTEGAKLLASMLTENHADSHV